MQMFAIRMTADQPFLAFAGGSLQSRMARRRASQARRLPLLSLVEQWGWPL